MFHSPVNITYKLPCLQGLDDSHLSFVPLLGSPSSSISLQVEVWRLARALCTVDMVHARRGQGGSSYSYL